MTSISLPTPDELDALPRVIDRTVDTQDLDLNGHMNARRYFDALVSTTRDALSAAGIDETYVAERHMGTFAAEHHIRYLGELRLGERLTTHFRFLERTDKAVRGQAFVANADQCQLACVLEVVAVHVDQGTRRPTSFPDDIAAALDAAVAASDQLGWRLENKLTLRRSR
jgi:acyl-CoA thioester hydrolase